MAFSKKQAFLSEEDLKKVSGGTAGAVNKHEDDKACGDFVCKECGGSSYQHKCDGNGRGSSSIFTSVYGEWYEE